jgi:alpha-aminoadipate carrier protein LysW
MTNVSCPECDAEILLDGGTEVGEIIVCSDCGVDLEVTAGPSRGRTSRWKLKTGE